MIKDKYFYLLILKSFDYNYIDIYHILSQMKNLFIFLQLFLFLYGQTGKITGNIKDSSSNEPLVGVSVMVVGKGIGADTDQDGRYSIINVPIGKYD
ncbi:MAG: hypothetical protein CM15mP64_8310 [Candidatus Neomarinimicrobiota bacterium]|nr:MAG: hypothetical protein CM15mP64_8310 [Candidatus Neomarinimicrobiota bacterium]